MFVDVGKVLILRAKENVTLLGIPSSEKKNFILEKGVYIASSWVRFFFKWNGKFESEVKYQFVSQAADA